MVAASLYAVPALAQAQAIDWKFLQSIDDPRTFSGGIEGAAASLISGKIYVSHGYRGFDTAFLSIYDIASDSWTHGGPSAPDALSPRSEMAGGTAFGRHYAIGGRPATAVVERFDPVTSTWATVAPMNTARAGLGAASWNNKIYAVGGRTGSTFGTGAILGANEVYDPVADTWTALAPMPPGTEVSDNYATIAHNGKVYVFGGAKDSITVTNAVRIYDIATNTWSSGTPMPTPRGAAMAGICGNKIAVFGGFDGSANLAVTELYDPATDSWSPGPPMAQAASEIAQGVTFDGTRIYAVGSGIFGPAENLLQALNCQPTVIPTVSAWGLLVLALILAAGGKAYFGRRSWEARPLAK